MKFFLLFGFLLLCFCIAVETTATTKGTTTTTTTTTTTISKEDGATLKRIAIAYPMLEWTDDENNQCQWKGVGCGEDGRVHYISLQDANLSGPLSDEFGKLSELRVLWLQQNQLTGAVPKNLAQLKKLRSLNLSDNKLVGSLPNDLLRLPLLETIWISQNSALVGQLPQVADLVNNGLQVIDFHGCSFDGTLPAGYFQLAELEELRVDSNQLSGALPDVAAGNALKLQRLLISNNRFDGSLPQSIVALPKLVDFRAAGNRLSGPLPTPFGGFLSHLDLSRNQLSGELPAAALCAERTLEFLSVHSNRFEGTLPLCLARMPSLSTLLAHNNRLSGRVPRFPARRFDSIRLHNNADLDFGGVEPDLVRLLVVGLDDERMVSSIVGGRRRFDYLFAIFVDVIQQPTPLIFAACVGAAALAIVFLVYLLRAIHYIVCCRCFRRKSSFQVVKTKFN